MVFQTDDNPSSTGNNLQSLYACFHQHLHVTFRVDTQMLRNICLYGRLRYFTGISSSVFFRSSQKGATVGIYARSVVVCGDFIVGPSETTSM